jgi:Tfp pilus assembly PilM family ATPase
VTNKIHAFKDRDVRRLVKAARAAGLNPTAIEVDIKASRIKVLSGSSVEHNAAPNEWDMVYDDGAAPIAIRK